jgi:hypothetical protein
MTDGPGPPEDSPGLIQPWIAQLRKITEELTGMTGSVSLFSPGPYPRCRTCRGPALSPRRS